MASKGGYAYKLRNTVTRWKKKPGRFYVWVLLKEILL